jgi:hypothetical protein
VCFSAFSTCGEKTTSIDFDSPSHRDKPKLRQCYELVVAVVATPPFLGSVAGHFPSNTLPLLLPRHDIPLRHSFAQSNSSHGASRFEATTSQSLCAGHQLPVCDSDSAELRGGLARSLALAATAQHHLSLTSDF